MSETVGVIGLGLLGGAIADRLRLAGRAACGYDPRPTASNETPLRASAADVVRESDAVIFCLPTSAVVAEVVAEAADAWRSGQVALDATTGSPEDAERAERGLAERGVRYLEMTVAGSSSQMRRGEAGLFLGGDRAVADGQASLLADLSPNARYLGPVGAASRFKLVHNMILGLNRAALAEGLRFAEALGFGRGDALAALDGTPAASEAMKAKGRRMADRDYGDPEARLSQHLKDVTLILAEARRAGMNAPLTERHRALLERAEELGFSEADNSAVAEAYR